MYVCVCVCEQERLFFIIYTAFFLSYNVRPKTQLTISNLVFYEKVQEIGYLSLYE
jgi:hypothetical protein